MPYRSHPVRPTIDLVEAALDGDAGRLLRAVIAEAEALEVELWLVGGVVRDCAAGLPLRDVDIAVPRESAALAVAVAARVGGEARGEPRFATASVRLGERVLDIATLRTERYARPGALPVVEPVASIEEDLQRRDFSVNAMALAAAGPRRGLLVDPLGGLDDFAARRLRALHERLFVDDATRLWRAARVAAALGLRPEPGTAAQLAEGARWLRTVSGERLWAELEHTARQRRTYATLRLLDGWGVLDGTHQALGLPPAAAAALRRRPGPHSAALLLALLLAQAPDRADALRRLAVDRETRRVVEQAAALLCLDAATPEALEQVEDCHPLARTAARWLDPARQPALQRALRRWERTRPWLDGRELTALGVPPGPRLGALLRELRRARYLGTLKASGAARAWVRSRIGEEHRR